MRDFGTEPLDGCSVLPGEEALSVSVLCRGELDAGFRAAWRGLDDDLELPNPFFAEWFLGPALDHLDPGGTVRLCIVRRGDGMLVALFPFQIGTRYARLPLRHVGVWRHGHGYDGTPLMRRGYGLAAFAAILDWIDGRPFGARFLRLTQLPRGEAMGAILNDACALADRAPREQSRIERAVLPPGGDFDAMMAAAMPGRKRKELRRQARRFGELGAARFIDLPTNDPAIAGAAEDFIALENAGWKAVAAHGEPLARSRAERAFFTEAMRAGAREGAVSCLVLALDLDMVAMLFCLRSGTQLSAFKTSYDERHAAHSPGLRLLMEATRRVLTEPGAMTLDSCARPGHPVVDRLWPARVPVVQLNIPTRHARDAALLDLAAGIERAKLAVLERRDAPSPSAPSAERPVR